MTFYHWKDQNLILFVQVQPNAKQNDVVGIYGNRLKIKTIAVPADGKANAAVCKLLAELFDIPKSQVTLLSGHSQREKCFCIKSPKIIPNFITSVS